MLSSLYENITSFGLITALRLHCYLYVKLIGEQSLREVSNLPKGKEVTGDETDFSSRSV